MQQQVTTLSWFTKKILTICRVIIVTAIDFHSRTNIKHQPFFVSLDLTFGFILLTMANGIYTKTTLTTFISKSFIKGQVINGNDQLHTQTKRIKNKKKETVEKNECSKLQQVRVSDYVEQVCEIDKICREYFCFDGKL